MIGAGLVGLASAAALAERGVAVTLLADIRRGEASPAAAGMLAPSVERHGAAALAFALAARDRYPSFLARLAARTGIDVPLNRLGILQLALDDVEATALSAIAPETARWLDGAELRALEPELTHAVGAFLHPEDGAVNNLVLMRALKALVGRHPKVRVVTKAAAAIDFTAHRVIVHTGVGERLEADRIVLAAGVWAPEIEGLPRAIPIEPVRGQMMSLAASPVRHVVYGASGYIVPRGDGRTLVGSTMERVGYDASTTPEGLAHVRAVGETICPALARARLLNPWAGLRPVTPDHQPIIGADPAVPALLYACGHARNGVLLAPLTGECIAALAAGEPPPVDISAFAISRFIAN